MLICFHATTEAKGALDAILATGRFRDISEAVSMALVNYNVIHQTVPQAGQIFPPDGPGPSACSIEAATAASSRPPSRPMTAHTTPSAVATSEIPDAFSLKTTTIDRITLLQAPPVPDAGATSLPPAQWLFGQFNKFLAPKATCRALLNLLLENPAGIPVAEASNKISYAACGLGDYLKALDDRLQSRREDAFSAAFPSSAIEGGGESRLRFGNQFVANIRQERLAGFPAALKLVAIDTAKEPRLSLTKAGADFAILENPVLDARGTPPTRKLSQAEVKFLLSHIVKTVPEEASAYLAILTSIAANANTPEKIDKYLCDRFQLHVVERAKKPNEITATFLTTQRTGAISRMVDLGLISREKTGLRVTSCTTTSGNEFTKTINAQ